MSIYIISIFSFNEVLRAYYFTHENVKPVINPTKKVITVIDHAQKIISWNLYLLQMQFKTKFDSEKTISKNKLRKYISLSMTPYGCEKMEVNHLICHLQIDNLRFENFCTEM